MRRRLAEPDGMDLEITTVAPSSSLSRLATVLLALGALAVALVALVDARDARREAAEARVVAVTSPGSRWEPTPAPAEQSPAEVAEIPPPPSDPVRTTLAPAADAAEIERARFERKRIEVEIRDLRDRLRRLEGENVAPGSVPVPELAPRPARRDERTPREPDPFVITVKAAHTRLTLLAGTPEERRHTITEANLREDVVVPEEGPILIELKSDFTEVMAPEKMRSRLRFKDEGKQNRVRYRR